ncbi:MAG: SDR family oxidoreductase, partial [Leptospiraceae bacterium]|nr:SDR family oxidoreductase [Leptospiraceae bacterium]
MGKFAGKRALVSGAGSGIGRALAQRLVREGARVWVTDRDEARVKETFGSLGSYGAGMSVLDHTKADEVESLFNEVTGWAIPDILCCNVGAGLGSPIDKMTLEDWRWITDVNYWSTVYMLHYFVPA